MNKISVVLEELTQKNLVTYRCMDTRTETNTKSLCYVVRGAKILLANPNILKTHNPEMESYLRTEINLIVQKCFY